MINAYSPILFPNDHKYYSDFWFLNLKRFSSSKFDGWRMEKKKMSIKVPIEQLNIC